MYLEYKQWKNFIKVVDKAKEACLNSRLNIIRTFLFSINKKI